MTPGYTLATEGDKSRNQRLCMPSVLRTKGELLFVLPLKKEEEEEGSYRVSTQRMSRMSNFKEPQVLSSRTSSPSSRQRLTTRATSCSSWGAEGSAALTYDQRWLRRQSQARLNYDCYVCDLYVVVYIF